MLILEDLAVNVRGVVEARRLVLKALEDSNDVVISISADNPVDICGLQLLESARIYAEMSGKTLRLSESSRFMAPVLEASGFLTDASPPALKFWRPEGVAE